MSDQAAETDVWILHVRATWKGNWNTVNLNQKGHHEDHNEKFDLQIIMDILSLLT